MAKTNLHKPDADPKMTKRQAENVRANISKRANRLAQLLDECAEGVREMTPTQVKAAQILLDRVVPTMQSIDQTTTTETPELTPEQIESMLTEYVAQHGTAVPSDTEQGRLLQ